MSNEPGFVVRVDAVPSSANRRLRMHWADRMREDQELRWLLRAALGPDHARHRRRPAYVQMAFHLQARPDDIDNRVARMKPLIDGLVGEGVLVDDSPEWMRLGAPPEHHRIGVGQAYTRIAVRYVPSFD